MATAAAGFTASLAWCAFPTGDSYGTAENWTLLLRTCTGGGDFKASYRRRGYLLASRYCETDSELSMCLSRICSGSPAGWARVQAICDFVHSHIKFDYLKARALTGRRGKPVTSGRWVSVVTPTWR